MFGPISNSYQPKQGHDTTFHPKQVTMTNITVICHLYTQVVDSLVMLLIINQLLIIRYSISYNWLSQNITVQCVKLLRCAETCETCMLY